MAAGPDLTLICVPHIVKQRQRGREEEDRVGGERGREGEGDRGREPVSQSPRITRKEQRNVSCFMLPSEYIGLP